MKTQAAKLIALSVTNCETASEQSMNREQELQAAECPDRALVIRVQQGDRRAFDMLVVKYQSRVQALVARLVREPQDVRDVAQEAFIKAYRSLPQFRGDSAFYTWLYRIALNAAKTHLSRNGRHVAHSLSQGQGEECWQGIEPVSGDSPEGELAGRQLHLRLQATLQKLPEELRVALMLREYDGLSYEQIADVLACPVGTVRSRIFRAREQVLAVVESMSREVGGVTG